MRFIANLSNETIEAFAEQEAALSAYLLSSHRVTPAALASARQVRELGLPLLADNGTKPLIDQVIAAFAERARELSNRLRDIQHAVGRSPRGGDIPDDLHRAASALADEVVAACTALSEGIDPDALIDQQLSMAPTDMIAQEDFAIACLIGLNLERELTGWRVARLETRNRRSLRLWQRVAADPRCAGVRVHAVLGAMDYNSAVAAGRLAAKAGVRHAALGFAGINLDQRATDFHVVGTATFAFERPVPRRYARVAQIVAGLAEGYRRVGGHLEDFHCLGLGAPPLFPVVAAGFDPVTRITTDATSPIHDATRHHVLYDAGSDGSRASILSIVQRILAGGDWPFLSPFMSAARARFGHDPAAAREWAAAHGPERLGRDDLAQPSGLTRALPLFTNADADIFRIVSRIWIAHNHWVLDRLAMAISEGDRRAAALASLDRQIDGAPSLTVTIRGQMAAREILERLIA